MISSAEIVVDVDGTPIPCSLRGTLKRQGEQAEQRVTIGDFVFVDKKNRITCVEKRYSVLARRDNLRRRKAHIIAANIDQVFIVSSVAEPDLKTSLIDRYIIAAKKGGIQPIVVINKIDLHSPRVSLDTLTANYEMLGIPYFLVSAAHENGMAQLSEAMEGKASVFSGQSGVGKTTLINHLAGTSFRIGNLASKTGKGSHTTTQASLIKLSHNTFCIDTPGIKSFSLWDISTDELTAYFSDLQQYAPMCKFANCSHTHEPECGVKQAVAEGKLSQLRYDSYLTIREGNDEDQKDHWE